MMNKKNNKYKSDSLDSKEDKVDLYQDAMISNLISVNNKSTSDSDAKKPTENRIELLKNAYKGGTLKPMIDFDDHNTETFMDKRITKNLLDARSLFLSMGVKLIYIKSGTTGHTFKAISRSNKNVVFAVKVCAYPKDDYGGIKSSSRPENVEIRMLKILSYFVVNRLTPHLVLPIGTFHTDIEKFINIPEGVIDLKDEKNDMYKKFIERYHDGEFEKFVSVLISEWCNGGDLLDYIRKNYDSMTLETWTVVIFQLLFTLALIHEKFPAFRHNDMKANNILVEKTDNKHEGPDKWYRYSLGSHVFIIPGIGIQIKIWDFDFASIDGIVENKKVNADWTKKINISKKKNMYYDMHYFFNTLISKRFFPQFYEGGVPQEIVDFVHRIVPEEFRNGSDNINKKGRILVDVEYTTPFKVIMTDPLFEKYRYNQYYFHPQRNLAPKKSILFQQGNGSKQPVPKKSTGQKPTKKV